jgi:transposase
MFEVEIYGRVRRAVRVEGKSQRAVAREFGLSRETVRKMLQYAVPPDYQRQQPIKRPKLEPWLGVIDAILNDDKQRPAKQRHTAKRIFERLKEEHRFTGGYTIVKDYVRMATLRSWEMFVPLVHPAGEAQVDFGEALVVIASVEQKAHYLVMDLPHSDDCFVTAFPAETTEASGVRVLRRRSHADTLRQQQDRRGSDPGRRGAAADAGLLRVTELLFVRR